MTARIVSLAALLALLAAGPAAAKGIDRVEICGADGCTDVPRKDVHGLVPAGSAAPPPAKPEPYFVLRLTIVHGEEEPIEPFSIRWLPASGLFRGEDGAWMTAPFATQRTLERLSAGMKPLGTRPASRPRPEEDGGGGPTTALAIGAPAGAAIVLLGLVWRRRRQG